MSALPQLDNLDKLASELAENPLKYAALAEKHNWNFHLNIDLDDAAERFQSIPHSTTDSKYPLTNLEQLYKMYRRVDQGLAPVEVPPERQKSLVLDGLEIKYAKPPGLLQSDSEVTQSESESEQWLDDTPRRQSQVEPDILRRQSVQALAQPPTIDLSHHALGQHPQTPKSNLVAAQSPSAQSFKQSMPHQEPAPCETPSTEKPRDLPDPVEGDPEPHTTPPITQPEPLTTNPQLTYDSHPEADLTIDDPSLLAADQPQSTSEAPRQVPSPALNRPVDQPMPAQPTEQFHPVSRSHLSFSTATPRRVSMPARIPSRPQYIATSRHANRCGTLSVLAPADADTTSNTRETSVRFRESTDDACKDNTAGSDPRENNVPPNTPPVDAGPSTGAGIPPKKVNTAQDVISSRFGSVQQERSESVARDNMDEEPGPCTARTDDVVRESSQIGTRAQPLVFDYPPTISPSSKRTSRLSGISVRTSRRCSVNIGLQTQLKKDDVSPDAAELRDARRKSSMGLIDRRQSTAGASPPLGFTDAVRAPNGVYECVVGDREFQLVVEEFLEAEEGMKGVQCSPAEIDADIDILFAPLFVEPEPVVEKKRKIDVAIQFTGVEDSLDRNDTPNDSGSQDAETQSIAAHSDGDVPPKKLLCSQKEMPKEGNLSERGARQLDPISKEFTSPSLQDDAQSLRNSERNYPRYSRRSAQIKSKWQSHFEENLEEKIPEESEDRTLRVSEKKIRKPISSKSRSGNGVSQRKREKATSRTKSARSSRKSKRLSKKQSSNPSAVDRSSAQDVEACKKRMNSCISPEREVRRRESVPFVVVIEPGDDDIVVEAIDDSYKENISVPGRLRKDESHARAGRKQSVHASGGGVEEAEQEAAKQQSREGNGRSAIFFNEGDYRDADVGFEDDEDPEMDPEMAEGEEIAQMDEGDEIPQVDEGEEVAQMDNGENIPPVGDGEEVPLKDVGQEILLMDDDDDVPPLARVSPEGAHTPYQDFESGDEDFGEEGEDEVAQEVSIGGDEAAQEEVSIGEDEAAEAAHGGSERASDIAIAQNVARVLDVEFVEEPKSRSTVMMSGGVDVEPEGEVEESGPKAAKKGGKRKRQGAAKRQGGKGRKLTPNTLRQARSKREMKRLGLSNLPVPAEAVLSDDSDCEEEQPRRSKRRKFPPLQYWKNEKKVYERRRSQLLPTVSQVVVAVEGGVEVESELSLEALKARQVVASRR